MGVFCDVLALLLNTLLTCQEPAPEQGAAGGAEGNQLRQGVGALMEAMRDLLQNIRMAEPHLENQDNGEEEEERPLEEWD